MKEKTLLEAAKAILLNRQEKSITEKTEIETGTKIFGVLGGDDYKLYAIERLSVDDGGGISQSDHKKLWSRGKKNSALVADSPETIVSLDINKIKKHIENHKKEIAAKTKLVEILEKELKAAQ